MALVLASRELGAERIIAMSRHQSRQKLATEFGATDIVTERGDEGVARIKELTNGLGAHSVIEAVGTQESMMQAIHSARPGGAVGYVGVSHDVQLPGQELFYSHVQLLSGPAPVRHFLPDLIDRICNGRIEPGKVFDLTLPLAEVAEGYEAMDERRPSRHCSVHDRFGNQPQHDYATEEVAMELTPPNDTAKAPASAFTGDVYVAPIKQQAAPSMLIASLVRFMPGARTNWHSHALGQTLHVTEGVGLVVGRDGTAIRMRAGDTVWTPPGQQHWHGGTTTNVMCHIAMLEGTDDGDGTTWLEPVSDDAYRAAHHG
jgi:quercetin dioxygenase-like cupin family protein